MKKNPDMTKVAMMFAIAFLFIFLVFSFVKGNKECPAEKVCPVCEKADCPVCECTDKACPDCPTVAAPQCPACKTCEVCPEGNGTEKIVYKYVCSDNRIVDNQNLCSVKSDSVFKPVMTNEEGTLIESVTVQPSCVYGRNGAKLYFKVGSISSTVNYQIKNSPEEEWKTVFTETNKYEGFRSVYFKKATDTYTKGDFSIPEGGVYLFRMEFVFDTFKQTSYSNEHVIDASLGGEFMQLKCS